MIKLLLPLVLALVGTGAGVGVGILLRPEPTPEVVETVTEDQEDKSEETAENPLGEESEDFEYVRLNNQFIVPVVTENRVSSLVVLSLSVQVTPGSREIVFQREPKLRDLFLQVLFDHANIGGFEGAFTNYSKMRTLRVALREVAQKTLPDVAHDVLIIDIVRQDV